jgi:amidase
MPITDYASWDGCGLAELVARGEVTPAELVEEAVGRVERHNPTLNAVIYPMFDIARAQAARLVRGQRPSPLHGVPFLLKDILGDHAGVPTTGGSRFLGSTPAELDSTLVARWKAAGLLPIGKTNAPEFGLVPTTEPARYGATRNPWSLAHSTGGSSGGSAAAVAAGIVPLAHANDGGGSIRIPAACCGLVGLKPTRARLPLGPIIGDSLSGLIVEGVVSRSVRDTAAALDVALGPEPGDPYCAPPVARPFMEEIRHEPARLRIAISTRSVGGRALHPDCVRAVEHAAALCRELGHVVEEATPPGDEAWFTTTFTTVWAAGLAMNIEAYATIHGRRPAGDDLEGLTWALYERGRQVSAAQYLLAIAGFQVMAREMARFFAEWDCWLTPALGAPPIENGVVPIHERDLDRAFAAILDYVPFTPIQNATGQPSISLPLWWNDAGLPVGVLFAGRFGDEATLLRLAAQLERAEPWSARRPSVWG